MEIYETQMNITFIKKRRETREFDAAWIEKLPEYKSTRSLLS